MLTSTSDKANTENACSQESRLNLYLIIRRWVNLFGQGYTDGRTDRQTDGRANKWTGVRTGGQAATARSAIVACLANNYTFTVTGYSVSNIRKEPECSGPLIRFSQLFSGH